MNLARGRGVCQLRCAVLSSTESLASMRSSTPLLRIARAAATTTTITATPKRYLSGSKTRTSTVVEHHPVPDHMPPTEETERAPLSVLPMTMILRSLATATVSSSKVLLPPSLRIMSVLANTSNPLLNPDKNPLLRYFLKKTFYAQFCAGENGAEVRSTIAGLQKIGFSGVILCYAKEVVLSGEQGNSLAEAAKETEEGIKNEIMPWTEGVLSTVRLTSEGDFVALKFTGAGSAALSQLKARLSPSPTLYKSIDAICQLAQERGVRLLFDAEQDMLQDGIDDWTIEFARKYNAGRSDALIFGTYQAYRKICPDILSRHLAVAQKDGFALGVKLVRGAYLGSDPRHLFHDTKEATDACYDDLATSVLKREWDHTVEGSGAYPAASLVVATHNAESVRRSRAICAAGEAKADIAFAQLQGMADEVSCELVEAGQGAEAKLPTFKYLTWGTTGECMKYLLRRAQENKDAVQRTKDSRDAMWSELVRRCKGAVGLA